MLKFLGVSRSGYLSFLNRKLSASKQRKEAVKKKIQKICDNSKQNYGAPKITQELRKSGETIAQLTVGKYTREMGIRAQWTKPWTTTTKDMQRSYSHKGYPYDNACIESFHSLIKREWLNRFNIINYDHAYRLIFEYIEAFYRNF